MNATPERQQGDTADVQRLPCHPADTGAAGATVRIGTRHSALALAQTELVAQQLRAAGLVCELVHVTTTGFRQYHLPTFADVPRTEVYFADTHDAIGPLGAKSMSESPFNPVAPALANALRDATGVRFTDLPLTRDRIWLGLQAAERTMPARSLPR